MRTMIATLPACWSLRPYRHKPPPSPRPRRPWLNSAPPRRSNWCAKAADGAGMAFTGGTLGLLALGSLRPELVSSHPTLAGTLLPNGGLRRVSLLVPAACADGLRQLAREYRARHQLGMSGGALARDAA
jgi:hypothetical protein